MNMEGHELKEIEIMIKPRLHISVEHEAHDCLVEPTFANKADPTTSAMAGKSGTGVGDTISARPTGERASGLGTTSR
jgi:hypothetical protein